MKHSIRSILITTAVCLLCAGCNSIVGARHTARFARVSPARVELRFFLQRGTLVNLAPCQSTGVYHRAVTDRGDDYADLWIDLGAFSPGASSHKPRPRSARG